MKTIAQEGLKTCILVQEGLKIVMLSKRSLYYVKFIKIKNCCSAIPSDLMKSTVVDDSLSSMNQQFCSRENQLLQLLQQNEKSTSMSFYALSLICLFESMFLI